MLELAKAGASVRQLEMMAKDKKEKKEKQVKKNKFYDEVELALKNELRRKVKITPANKGKGTLTIEFFSDDELSEFARRLAE
jgi:ParB family chromosome partitioning protein